MMDYNKLTNYAIVKLVIRPSYPTFYHFSYVGVESLIESQRKKRKKTDVHYNPPNGKSKRNVASVLELETLNEIKCKNEIKKAKNHQFSQTSF